MVSFLSRVDLSDQTVNILLEDVKTQLTGGIGENGFDVDILQKMHHVEVCNFEVVRVRQCADDRVAPPSPLIAIAVKSKDRDRFEQSVQVAADTINLHLQGYSALHYAVIMNQVELVEMLLSLGADVNLQGVNGKTPLMACASAGMLSDSDSCAISTILIQHGADSSVKSSNGETAAEIAKIYNKGIIRFLRTWVAERRACCSGAWSYDQAIPVTKETA